MAKVARLLERIVPENYRLNLDVDVEKFSFRCLEEIVFVLAKPSRELTLHAKDLKVAKAKLDDRLKAATIVLSKEAETVTFSFEDEIPAGKHTLDLDYSGEVQDSLHGFYRSSYTHEGQEKWLVTTQFEAVHAREAIICIDEPSAKAIFEVTLQIPESLTAISNAQVVSEVPVDGGRKAVQFGPTPKMSTYLLAFAAGEFEYVENVTTDGTTVRAYATPGKAGQLNFALETAVQVLVFYNDYFGIHYPLPKLDMVAIPDFGAGAMENWGMVTYRETDLLLDEFKTSLANKQRIVQVVAHELAHQWFGNLVTLSWWEDLWLNEGFATWVEVLAMDKLFPQWGAWDEFASSTLAYAMDLDGLANTHPIQVPVDDPRSLDEIFDAISYYKGASIINMIHQYVGAEDFRKGLHTYLMRHQYGNTVTHDLWTALAEVSGKPVDAVMSAWTGQPGYPLVSFEDGLVKQARFYSSPREAKKASKASELWPLPLSMALPDSVETAPQLIREPTEVDPEVMASAWFKPNPGQTAFFRTLYTQPMIQALGGPLQDKQLGVRDRFGIVSDVWANIAAGRTGSAAGLALLASLREEPDYVVWCAVSDGLAEVRAIIEDAPLRDELDRFGDWLVKPNLDRLGWEPKASESPFDTLMRPVVLMQAVLFGDKEATAEAKRRFEGYLLGEELNPDLRGAILFAVARDGGEREFEEILKHYRAEETPQAKMSLLAALGRFRKPELIQRFLDLGISPDVRPQDIFMVVASGFRSREAREMTWTFVKEHWQLFLDRYGEGGHMLERFPAYAGMGFATHTMAMEIKTFFESHPHPGTKRPAAQAVESVELKADWYERDRAEIEAFLAERR